jgi:hypothetical protein
MADVPAIDKFTADLNVVINDLLFMREDMNASERLWDVLDAKAKSDIKARTVANLDAAKVALNAIVVP